MKTLFAFLFSVSYFSLQVQSALILRGTDSLGHRLIYDTDRDITWYDFTYHTTYRTDEFPNGGWVEAVQWAADLTVTLAGFTYSDWRLPSAGENPQLGYNQTTPEMGHLYYSELGNLAYPEPGWGLQNKGPFQHLEGYSWAAERTAPGQDSAWLFTFAVGHHSPGHTDLPYGALAVRAGDVVPEPLRIASIARVGAASARIAWSGTFANHVLEYATNLPAAGWTTVTNQVTTNASQLSVTVPTDAALRFYRLRRP